MASPAQIAANRLNSRKSTGPRTPEGQAKSSMNALKHGNRSRKLALLREESLAFEERLRKWMAIGDAQNDVEEYLVYRNVALSFEIDRAERARLERCASLIENSDEEEAAEAEAVGKQLFFDAAGPTPLYGNTTFFAPKKKTSWNGEAVDPHDPRSAGENPGTKCSGLLLAPRAMAGAPRATGVAGILAIPRSAQGHSPPGPSAARGERGSARRHDLRGQSRPPASRRHRV